MTDSDAPVVRLDLWLWAARFFRTRSLAKQAIETGKVDVAGQRAKPSRTVRVGDCLRVSRGEEQFEVSVAGISDTRGPASALHQGACRTASCSTRSAPRTARRSPLARWARNACAVTW